MIRIYTSKAGSTIHSHRYVIAAKLSCKDPHHCTGCHQCPWWPIGRLQRRSDRTLHWASSWGYLVLGSVLEWWRCLGENHGRCRLSQIGPVQMEHWWPRLEAWEMYLWLSTYHWFSAMWRQTLTPLLSWLSEHSSRSSNGSDCLKHWLTDDSHLLPHISKLPPTAIVPSHKHSVKLA